jgi:hypothetical protein
VPNALVAFATADHQMFSANSDADGQFTIPVRSPGPFFLSAVVAAGLEPLSANSRETSPLVVEGGTKGLHLALQPWVERVGLVEDLEHHPIAGATVTVEPARHGAEVVRTNAEGKFSYRPLAGELWMIRHPGFVDQAIPPSSSWDPATTWPFTLIPIAPRGTRFVIEGQVLDELGAGIANARVTARPYTTGFSKISVPSGSAHVTVSDDVGKFELRVDAPGKWWVEAETDVDDRSEDVLVNGRSARVTISLAREKRSGTLVGRVKGPDGALVDQFTVSVIAFDLRVARHVMERNSRLDLQRLAQPVLVQRFATPTGQFRLTGLPHRIEGIQVDAPDFASKTVRGITMGADTPCEVTLEEGATVTGVLSSVRTRAPLQRAAVRLVGEDSRGVRTGPDGAFTIRGLPSGSGKELLVTALEPNFQPLNFPLAELKAGAALGPLKIELSEREPGSSAPEIIGIGIVTGDMEDDTLDIVQVHPSGGARSAGVQEGDLIVAVDGESIAGQTREQIFGRLRGAEGSVVRVTVKREEQRLDFSIVRRRLKF